MAGYEALIIIILFASVGGVSWLLINKKSDATIYQKDSNPRVSEFTMHCSPFSCCNDKVDEFMEGLKNERNVNSQINRN